MTDGLSLSSSLCQQQKGEEESKGMAKLRTLTTALVSLSRRMAERRRVVGLPSASARSTGRALSRERRKLVKAEPCWFTSSRSSCVFGERSVRRLRNVWFGERREKLAHFVCKRTFRASLYALRALETLSMAMTCSSMCRAKRPIEAVAMTSPAATSSLGVRGVWQSEGATLGRGVPVRGRSEEWSDMRERLSLRLRSQADERRVAMT